MADDDDHHHRLLGSGAASKSVEELHRVRRMRERDEARVVQCGKEEAGGIPDAFGHAVVPEAAPVVELAPALREDHDEPGRDLEMRLLGRGPDGFERLQPLVASRPLV
jgi:hypothetical protein